MSSPVIIYDGVCHLCNATVNFILRHERDATLRFTPNQSSYARELLDRAGLSEAAADTILFFDSGTVLARSDAIIQIAAYLKWPWSMARYMRILPRSFRDWLYRLVARNRYRLFGKSAACILPDESIRQRFIGL